jgi:hypothetical protein
VPVHRVTAEAVGQCFNLWVIGRKKVWTNTGSLTTFFSYVRGTSHTSTTNTNTDSSRWYLTDRPYVHTQWTLYSVLLFAFCLPTLSTRACGCASLPDCERNHFLSCPSPACWRDAITNALRWLNRALLPFSRQFRAILS